MESQINNDPNYYVITRACVFDSTVESNVPKRGDAAAVVVVVAATTFVLGLQQVDDEESSVF